MPSLSIRRYTHWMIFIYKTLLGLVPTYLCTLFRRTGSRYALRSNDFLHYFAPRVRTEKGKKAFSFSAPSDWNALQSELKLSEFASLEVFRSILRKRQCKSFERCSCSWIVAAPVTFALICTYLNTVIQWRSQEFFCGVARMGPEIMMRWPRDCWRGGGGVARDFWQRMVVAIVDGGGGGGCSRFLASGIGQWNQSCAMAKQHFRII